MKWNTEQTSLPSGRDVLVVEDEPRIREMLDAAVRQMNFNVTLTDSAETAIRSLAHRPHDIIILDLNLPEMGGMEFLGMLRREEIKSQVIILTGHGDLEAAKQALHLDVVEFLTKPFGLGDLEIALDRARKRCRAQIIDDGAEESQVTQFRPEPRARQMPAIAQGSEAAAVASMEDLERRHILTTLQKNNGNRAATASELGISLRKLYYRLGQYHREGFTLLELLVVVGIIAVLVGLLLPALSGVRESANRVKCGKNLQQLYIAMLQYGHDDATQDLPRAQFDKTKKQLLLGNQGYGVADTFGKSGYVGENNVPAALFLLFKNQNLLPDLLLCPGATGVVPGYVTQNRQETSNWNNYTDNVSYSLAAPYPGTAAEQAGFSWKVFLKADFALMADINPGTRGSGVRPNNVVGPTHDAGSVEMVAANSNNHRNKGQNVVYGDGHVEFQTTPYCGAPHRGNGIPDNIYTAGNGDNGTCSDKSLPVDAQDSVMLPTDDAGGN